MTQVGLAMMLLVGAGLLIRSFQKLNQAELGFESDGVLTLSLALPPTRYPDGAARWSYYRDLLARVDNLPGVEAVGAVSSLPLAGNDGDSSFLLEGRPVPEPGVAQAAWVRPSTEGYFEVLGIDLVEGRGFEAGDDAGATQVIVVNETLAARYFPDGDALGRRLGFGPPERPNWRLIVGVAHDVRHFGIRAETRPAVYLPYRQASAGAMSLVVAVDGDPAAFAATVRQAVSDLDPALAASQIAPLQDLVDAALAPDRFVTGLLTLFAVAALLLAAVGIYGVVSYGVTSRMREMGIRLALGADGGDVLRLVVRSAMSLVVGGVLLGILGSLAVGRVLATLVFEIGVTDATTFVVTGVGMALVALLAAWLPARRAGGTDPVRVLRQE